MNDGAIAASDYERSWNAEPLPNSLPSALLEMNHKPPILRQSPVAQTAIPSEHVKRAMIIKLESRTEQGYI